MSLSRRATSHLRRNTVGNFDCGNDLERAYARVGPVAWVCGFLVAYCVAPTVRVEDIPPEIIALVDERAGRVHSAEGRVLSALAEALEMWDRIRPCRCETRSSSSPES